MGTERRASPYRVDKISLDPDPGVVGSMRASCPGACQLVEPSSCESQCFPDEYEELDTPGLVDVQIELATTEREPGSGGAAGAGKVARP